MPARGESDMGLFALSATTYFEIACRRTRDEVDVGPGNRRAQLPAVHPLARRARNGS